MGAAPHLLRTTGSDDFENQPPIATERREVHRLGGPREALFANALIAYCRLIAWLFPARQWYSVALATVRLVLSAGRPFAPKPTLNSMEASSVARVLHRFLDILWRFGRFPIPIRLEGEELLLDCAANPAGFICCSAHLPFVKTFFPIARKAIGNARERWVISRTPEKDNVVEIWNDEPWKAIFADNSALLKVRAVLRRNACLVAIIDKDQGDVVSANIFRFAGKVNARVLTWFPELQADGTILIRIAEPPRPGCKSEEDIAVNLRFVEENVESILHGTAGAAARRAAVEGAREAESLRDVHRVQLYSTQQLRARIQRLATLLNDQETGLSERFPAQKRLAMLESELRLRVRAD